MEPIALRPHSIGQGFQAMIDCQNDRLGLSVVWGAFGLYASESTKEVCLVRFIGDEPASNPWDFELIAEPLGWRTDAEIGALSLRINELGESGYYYQTDEVQS